MLSISITHISLLNPYIFAEFTTNEVREELVYRSRLSGVISSLIKCLFTLNLGSRSRKAGDFRESAGTICQFVRTATNPALKTFKYASTLSFMSSFYSLPVWQFG